WRIADGASDHQKIGAQLDRFGGCTRTLVVVGRSARGANPGADQSDLLAVARSEQGDFSTGDDEAVDARVERGIAAPLQKALELVGGLSVLPSEVRSEETRLN